jgi:hypothetical protein
MFAGASAQAKAEADVLTAKGVTYDKNNAEYESYKKRTQEANIEETRLLRLASLGPATQQYTDLVAQVMNEGAVSGEPGFDELHCTKISAKFVDQSSPVPGSSDYRKERVPEVSFDAVARPISARPPAQVYQEFSTLLKGKETELKTIKVDVGAFQPSDGSFKFSIRSLSPLELQKEPQ